MNGSQTVAAASRRQAAIIVVLLIALLLSICWWLRPLTPEAKWQVGSGWTRISPKSSFVYGVDVELDHTEMGLPAIGSYIGPLRIWDAVSGEERFRALTASDRIASVDVSPDDRWLAVANGIGEVTIWELPGGKFWARPTATPADRSDGSQIRFSPDSRFLAYATESSVVLWDVVGDKLKTAFPGSPRAGENWWWLKHPPVHFSRDGSSLLVSFDAVVWDLSQQKERFRIHKDKPVAAAVLSSDGCLLATGWNTGEIDVSMVATGKRYAAFNGGQNLFSEISFSRDGHLLLLEDPNFDADQLWDISVKPPIRLEPGRGQVKICVSQDGNRMAASVDGEIVICNTRPFEKRHVLKAGGLLGWPHISPNGETLISQLHADPFGDDETFAEWLCRKLGLPVPRGQFSVIAYDVESGARFGEFAGEWVDFSSDGQAFFTTLATGDSSTLIMQRWRCPPVKSPVPMAITLALAVALLMLLLRDVIRRIARLRAASVD